MLIAINLCTIFSMEPDLSEFHGGIIFGGEKIGWETYLNGDIIEIHYTKAEAFEPFGSSNSTTSKAPRKSWLF